MQNHKEVLNKNKIKKEPTLTDFYNLIDSKLSTVTTGLQNMSSDIEYLKKEINLLKENYEHDNIKTQINSEEIVALKLYNKEHD